MHNTHKTSYDLKLLGLEKKEKIHGDKEYKYDENVHPNWFFCNKTAYCTTKKVIYKSFMD